MKIYEITTAEGEKIIATGNPRRRAIDATSSEIYIVLASLQRTANYLADRVVGSGKYGYTDPDGKKELRRIQELALRLKQLTEQ